MLNELHSVTHPTGAARRIRTISLIPLILLGAFALVACGSGGGGGNIKTGVPQVATPSIKTAAAQSGAQIVTLSDTTPGSTIYYTLDGTAPTTSSAQFFAPLLVSSSQTLTAMATAPNSTNSTNASQTVGASIPSGTLVWSDEFSNSTGANAQPDPKVWTYDTGNSGFGNNELETYCAWGSTTAPCDTANPNAYVGTDGYLHVVARNPSAAVYTSARLKSQGLFSLSSGRIEARIMLPEGQGLWPAFWLLGNNIATVNWPACGEQDVMEHINVQSPDWIEGSIHGTNLDGGIKYQPSGFTASGWHTYGMIWSKGTVSYYVDSTSNVYATFTNANLATGAVWPFDSNAGEFIILNLAVGGNWPGSPDVTTPFPSQMLVDYVRVYTN